MKKKMLKLEIKLKVCVTLRWLRPGKIYKVLRRYKSEVEGGGGGIGRQRDLRKRQLGSSNYKYERNEETESESR